MLRLQSFGDAARLEVCTQLLEALAWIHDNGIMHRDLKPQNMGLKSSSPPEAVIFDFGHATFDEASTDHMKGTIWYLAPEILDLKYRHSRAPYDRAVDVWSMGISLYQLICYDRALWSGMQIFDRGRRASGYTLDPLDTVNKELDQSPLKETAKVIRSMIEVDSSLRITATDAWHALSDKQQDIAVRSSKRQKVV